MKQMMEGKRRKKPHDERKLCSGLEFEHDDCCFGKTGIKYLTGLVGCLVQQLQMNEVEHE
jgi:hypothetical protein